jgi:hypothetical protein
MNIQWVEKYDADDWISMIGIFWVSTAMIIAFIDYL